jgi:Ca2+/Na+ antiporter
VLQAELPAVLGVSALLFVLMLMPWKRENRISRFEGMILLVAYLACGFALVWGR